MLKHWINWLTFARRYLKCCAVEQFNKIEVLPKVFVNGELTLTENTGMQHVSPNKGHRSLAYIHHISWPEMFFGQAFPF
jgi:hypothetical protein